MGPTLAQQSLDLDRNQGRAQGGEAQLQVRVQEATGLNSTFCHFKFHHWHSPFKFGQTKTDFNFGEIFRKPRDQTANLRSGKKSSSGGSDSGTGGSGGRRESGSGGKSLFFPLFEFFRMFFVGEH